MDFLGSRPFFVDPSTQMARKKQKKSRFIWEKKHEFLSLSYELMADPNGLDFRVQIATDLIAVPGWTTEERGLSLGRMYFSKHVPKWREQNMWKPNMLVLDECFSSIRYLSFILNPIPSAAVYLNTWTLGMDGMGFGFQSWYQHCWMKFGLIPPDRVFLLLRPPDNRLSLGSWTPQFWGPKMPWKLWHAIHVGVPKFYTPWRLTWIRKIMVWKKVYFLSNIASFCAY